MFGRFSPTIRSILGAVMLLIVSIAIAAEEVRQVVPSDPEAGAQFGFSAGLDVDTLVVGANLEDETGATDRGAVYVFTRNTGGTENWGQVQKLFATDYAATDWFGASVAVSGDTVIVGCQLDDDGGSGSGSAYLFYRNEGGANNWGQKKKIVADDDDSGDNFGQAVAIDADTALVGAYGDEYGGSAYVFDRNQNGSDQWGQKKKLTGNDTADGDQFGLSVSIDGDLAIVGAPTNDDNSADASGSAYVFSRNQGGSENWGEVAELHASDPETGAQFGAAVSISGDYAVVGARYKDCSAGQACGAAYVFYKDQGGSNNWGQVAILTASDAGADDFFGSSLGISGSIVIVGASGNAIASTDQGAAYIFHQHHLGTDNWGQVALLTASDAGTSDQFGWAVTASGNNGVAGAFQWETSGGTPANSGAVYVFGELCPCPADFNKDGRVNVSDLLSLLADWGTADGDVDGDSDTDVGDLLALLAAWGFCPCHSGTPSPTLEEVLEEAGLTEQDWDDFVDIMTNGTTQEKANWKCWMDHYLTICHVDCGGGGHSPASCPGVAPFGPDE
jgi:hypothetical protein